MELITIEYTSNFGLIKENLETFDEHKILGNYLLNYKIQKIKCYYEKNVGICGFQIFYVERMTSQEIKTIDIGKKIKNDNIEEQEIVLEPNEMINKITIWICEQFRGFEVGTNKDKKQKFGWCEENNNCKKIDLDEFYKDNNFLVGFYGAFHKIDGILSMGFYYVREKLFYLFSYDGIFRLRVKLKNEEFKKRIFDNFNNLKLSDKALCKVCCLPDNQFFGIIKYIFF